MITTLSFDFKHTWPKLFVFLLRQVLNLDKPGQSNLYLCLQLLGFKHAWPKQSVFLLNRVLILYTLGQKTLIIHDINLSLNSNLSIRKLENFYMKNE